METFINNLKEIVTIDMIIYGLIIIAAVLIITIVMRSLRVKKARAQLEEMEIKYNELKSVPLSFKLNKANALSKVNHDILDLVNSYQEAFNQVSEQLKEYSVVLAEIDDLVYAKKVKKATEKMEQLSPLREQCMIDVNELNEQLDDVLEQENMQREGINVLKNKFRELKQYFLVNRGSYRQSVEFLDGLVVQIENMFSIFEEWMFASEFNKANEKQQEIKQSLESFDMYLKQLPLCYETACVVIANEINEIKTMTTEVGKSGVYLKHLSIDDALKGINANVDDVINKLSEGVIDRAAIILDDAKSRLDVLKKQIKEEFEAYREIAESIEDLFARIKELNITSKKIQDTYYRVHERFGFESLGENLKLMEEHLDALNEFRFRMESVIDENNVPFTTVLVTFNQIAKDTENLEAMAKDMKQKLDNATSDEERAKKQLVKLQMIVNEMRIQFIKHRLPSVDEKFEEDIRNANIYITDIKVLLEEIPLNVEALNAKLKEAIDFIYTLYNSVNNLVGMAKMVENAILFGNRYRSEYPEVDAELTRAELCFSNGQYTKALKISISTIEKIHPGVYEKLLAAGKSGEIANA